MGGELAKPAGRFGRRGTVQGVPQDGKCQSAAGLLVSLKLRSSGIFLRGFLESLNIFLL